MVKKLYKTRSGLIPVEKAQVYGEELEKLMQQKGGELTTEEIVKEAKKKTSVFHDFFEWDNTKAGEEYRKHQARLLVANIVEVVIVDAKETEQRSFFNVRNAKQENVYVNLNTATKVKDYKTQLLDKIINHLDNTTVLMKMFRDS